jgi:hypothetical protein
MNTRRKLGLHAQTLVNTFDRRAQADVRDATQVLERSGQAISRVSCLSQVLDRCAEAFGRGAVPCASQVLIVVPRPLPTEQLAVHRTYLIVVPRPVPTPLPAATRSCRSWRRTFGRYAEEQRKYNQLHLRRGNVPLAANVPSMSW